MKNFFVLLFLVFILISCNKIKTQPTITEDIKNNQQKVSIIDDNSIIVNNTNLDTGELILDSNKISNLNSEDLNSFYQKLLTDLYISGITKYNIFDKKVFLDLNGNDKIIEYIEKKVFDFSDENIINEKQKYILNIIVSYLKQDDLNQVNTQSNKLISDYILSNIIYENKSNYLIDVNDKNIPKEIINEYIILETKLSNINNEKDEQKEALKKEIYKNNSDVFINLFKLNKLDIFKVLKIGNNEIYITGVDKNPEIESNTLECGNYMDFGGSKKYNECLTIIKDKNDKIIIKYGDIIKADYVGEKLYEIIDNKYLLQSFSNGDGCVGVTQYILFDKNLNKFNFLQNNENGCYIGNIESKVFEMGKYFITISNNNYITYGKIDDVIDKNIKYNIYKQILSNAKKINLDIKNTILSVNNGSRFSLDIDGKRVEFLFSQIDKENSITTFLNGEQYLFDGGGFMLLNLDNKSKNDFTIIGSLDKTLLFPGEYEESIKKSVVKVEILSCVNNSYTYDTKWYKLNSLDIKKDDKNIYEFKYSINEKYGNICSMKTPYKIRFYDEKGDFIESEFSLDIN